MPASGPMPDRGHEDERVEQVRERPDDVEDAAVEQQHEPVRRGDARGEEGQRQRHGAADGRDATTAIWKVSSSGSMVCGRNAQLGCSSSRDDRRAPRVASARIDPMSRPMPNCSLTDSSGDDDEARRCPPARRASAAGGSASRWRVALTATRSRGRRPRTSSAVSERP